jgi:hypothetical protein
MRWESSFLMTQKIAQHWILEHHERPSIGVKRLPKHV